MDYRSVKTRNLNEFLRLLIILTTIISILTITPPAAASDLDEFEEAAITEDTKQESDDEDDEEGKEDEDDEVYQSLAKDDDDDDSFLESVLGVFFEIIIGTFFSVIGDGAKMSLARVDEGAETDTAKVEIRRTGEPTLPFFQYEHKYLRVSSDINARDDSLEIGYGPFGFNCRHTDFSEENPSDELTLTQYHLLLRISRTSSGEFGVGIGSLVMRGNDDNSGLSLTVPIKFYPGDSFGVRFKPTYSWINGNAIDEYDVSLAYIKR